MSSLLLAANLIMGASAIVATFPSNMVAVVGSKVTLECRTNTSKKLIWKQRLLNATNDSVLLETFFTGNQFSKETAQRYAIIHESVGQFDLKFNATLNHGNEYTCIEPGGYNFSSQVIVLASEPKCYVNGTLVTSNPIILDEEEYVELECNLTFAGRWSPSLQWTQRVNSESDWTVIASQEETTKRDNIYFTSTTLAFNATNNATSFMCTTRFLESGRPKSITAENIPDYSHNWTSPTFVLRSFYETFRTNKEDENKGETIEMKDLFILVPATLAATALLCIVVIVTAKLVNSKVQQPTTNPFEQTTDNPPQPATHNPPQPVIHNLAQSATHSLVVIGSDQQLMYSEVKKKSVKRREDPLRSHLECDLQDPTIIYSEVYNPGTPQTGHASSQLFSAESGNSHKITGSDGTEYAMLPVFAAKQPPHHTMPRKEIFETSVYASVDHNNTIVPCPPRSCR